MLPTGGPMSDTLVSAHPDPRHLVASGGLPEPETASRRPLRITIIDHHLLFADSLALTLEQEGYLATAIRFDPSDVSMAAVLAAALRSAGRLVLLEQDLGRVGDGIRLVAPLTASGASVVLLTESLDRALWGEALRQGAKHVLHKTCSVSEVAHTARRIHQGLPLMPQAQREALMAEALDRRDEEYLLRSRLARLTTCESEVLEALMKGAQVREIARSRVVVEATVRSQIKSILAKLEMRSQVSVVCAAYRVGWQPRD